MSLVGSLEDLGLGDILQIISLSRKSGLLLLRSEEGDGRIVFCDGLVRAAFVKGEVEDLRGLLVGGGFIDGSVYDRAATTAAAHGDPTDAVLSIHRPELSSERLESLRREHAERCAFRMFSWTTGEFSFEIREDTDARDQELLLATGINAQYLTMEATRIADERGDEAGDDIEFGTIDDCSGARSAADDGATHESAVAGEEPEVEPDATLTGGDSGAIADTLAMAAVERVEAIGGDEDPDASPTGVGDEVGGTPVVADPDAGVLAVAPAPAPVPAPSPTPAPAAANPTAMILIDPDLNALEWQKSVLGPICRRIHSFQRPEDGIMRLRQYLLRGEEPVVLIAHDLPADSHSGIADSLELVRRMRAHAPRLSIHLVDSVAQAAPSDLGGASGLLRRPANHQVANRRAWSKLEAAGRELRDALANRVEAAAQPVRSRVQGRAAPDLQQLKQIRERLRNPSVRGEVLSLILDFAAESFSRVAIFMVRDDDAIGMAQVGLEGAGGPGDAEFREISLPVLEPGWFRAVLERNEGIAAPPTDEGDHRLAALLGSSAPSEAYVAPIESSRHVVALIYADNLPAGRPLGDTTLLELVLMEAGLALERALLERAGVDSKPDA